MSVTLSPPSQLGFPRPLTTIVKRSLFIHNPHSSPVAFKVKTTAPKQYCVRPNQGRVEPNETVEVHIVLQPLPADPPPHAKCKDKFLVQSTFIPPDEEIRTLPEMWTTVERTNKAAIHEQKIRCAYLPAEDGSGDPNGIPEENEDSHADISKLDESSNSRANSVGDSLRGLTQWTTGSDRDLSAFPNGGYTVWEIENKVANRNIPPKPPKIPSKSSAPPVLPKTTSFPPAPLRHEIILKVEAPEGAAITTSCPHNGSCDQCSPALFSAAEASPSPKSNGATQDSSAIVGGAAGAAAGLAGAGAVHAARSPSSTMPAGAPGTNTTSGLPASDELTARQAPVAVPTARELPPLSAADVAAVPATNIALEKSVLASTPESEQLAVALKEIERLKAQLAEAQGPAVTGLRKRGGAAGDAAPGAKTATVSAASSAQGVPLEVCAGLVFAVFVLTYLFF